MKLQQLPLLIVLSLGFSPMLIAQDIPKPEEEMPTISPDRPGWGECSNVLPKKTAHLEIGFYFDQTLPKLNYREENINYISGLVRWGGSNRFELRFGVGGWNQARIRQKNSNNVISKVSGYQPLQFGTKIQILEEGEGDSWKPNIAFVGMLTLPWVGKKEFRPENVAPSCRLVFASTPKDWVLVESNLGVDWDGTGNTTWFATLATEMTIVKNFVGYAETAFWINQDFNDVEIGFDGGFMYIIKNVIQLDISAGYTYHKETPWWFAGAGFSWRFPK